MTDSELVGVADPLFDGVIDIVGVILIEADALDDAETDGVDVIDGIADGVEEGPVCVGDGDGENKACLKYRL